MVSESRDEIRVGESEQRRGATVVGHLAQVRLE